MRRTIEEIEGKVAAGDAIILTVREVEELIASGREHEVREADVVTTGTMGIMSGTYALLSFPIAKAGEYRRFTKVSINGVPTSVGPCPNESLGVIDLMVFGTMESEHRPDYGGSFLLRELVEGKEVSVEATSNDGRTVEKTLTIDEMPTAKLLSTRNCFRNYRAFVNPSESEFRSIFSCQPFPPRFGGLSFSGCGHLNPLQNDPQLRHIGVGSKVLYNGTEGFVFSTGTRCSPKYPNLMTVANMRSMDPWLMGGFITGAGPECLASYAYPIPILDDATLKLIMIRDQDIPLSVGDIRDRHKIGQADYGQVWSGRDEVITEDKAPCIHCQVCAAKGVCPTFAIIVDESGPTIDRSRCVNCGACVRACEDGCFKGFLGDVRVRIEGVERVIPIVCRSSNREGALRTMNDLKKRILDGSFQMTTKVAEIEP